MLVALDARMLGADLHGLGRYVYSLAGHLAAGAPDDRFVLLGDSPWAHRLAEEHANLEVVPVHARPFSPGEHLELPRTLARLGPDLFHATSAALPAIIPVPFCATIPDLIPLRFGGGLRYELYFRRYLPWTARRARGLLAFSEAVRRDLEAVLGIPPERVTVAPLGVDPAFRPEPAGPDEAAILERELGVTPPYLLVAGNPRPHKNLPFALEVFRQLAARPTLAGITLVLLSRSSPALAAAVAAHPAREVIKLVEYVAEERLPALYRRAAAFFYPSLHEGFGLPVLEALACGAVVVSSDAAALAEVAGDAALLVDARDAGACADAVERALTETALRAALPARGVARAAGFTWEACARRTMEAYRKSGCS